MTALAQYTTQRATAGTRYQAAVTELLAALVDLAALDRTIESGKAGGAIPQRTFGGEFQNLPQRLAHPVFAPFAPRFLVDEIKAQADTYIAALT